MILALLLVVGVPTSASAALQQLTNLFVFGDSLSDGGNSGLLSQAAYRRPTIGGPFTSRRRRITTVSIRTARSPSNICGTYTTRAYQLPTVAAGGTNYAIGGATTGLESFNSVNPNVPAALQPVYAQKSNAWQLLASFAPRARSSTRRLRSSSSGCSRTTSFTWTPPQPARHRARLRRRSRT
jgi:phospholipase/lecithinase/hemolysin